MAAPSFGGIFFTAIWPLILTTVFVSPAAADTLGACVKNNSGNIKMADSAADCKNSEYFISWNDQGPIGMTGPAGADGDDGADGAPGVDGAPGATGSQGPIGLTGATGSDGNDGVDGQDGATGLQGPIGLTGPAGADGTNGSDGQDGLACWDLNGDGVQDPAEDINIDGSFNALDCAGPQGLAGADGDDGADGAPGVDGAPGATGSQGPIGLTGATGSDGNDGVDGQDGAIGATGPQGPIGLTGPAGPEGPPGENGSGGDATFFTYSVPATKEFDSYRIRISASCGLPEFGIDDDVLTGGGCEILGADQGAYIISSAPRIFGSNTPYWSCEATCDDRLIESPNRSCEDGVLYAWAVCASIDPVHPENPNLPF